MYIYVHIYTYICYIYINIYICKYICITYEANPSWIWINDLDTHSQEIFYSFTIAQRSPFIFAIAYFGHHIDDLRVY